MTRLDRPYETKGKASPVGGMGAHTVVLELEEGGERLEVRVRPFSSRAAVVRVEANP